jgi:hypothetical protein
MYNEFITNIPLAYYNISIVRAALKIYKTETARRFKWLKRVEAIILPLHLKEVSE